MMLKIKKKLIQIIFKQSNIIIDKYRFKYFLIINKLFGNLVNMKYFKILNIIINNIEII